MTFFLLDSRQDYPHSSKPTIRFHIIYYINDIILHFSRVIFLLKRRNDFYERRPVGFKYDVTNHVIDTNKNKYV